jgi:hypothetical protein
MSAATSALPQSTKYDAQRSTPGHQGQDPQTTYEAPLEIQLELNSVFIANVKSNLRHYARLLRGYEQQRSELLARDVRTQARVRDVHRVADRAAAVSKDALIGRMLA